MTELHYTTKTVALLWSHLTNL